MNIKRSGRYLIGLFCDDAGVAASYIRTIGKNL
jgi:hypothetical protein